MPANVGEMFYTEVVPWHGLGAHPCQADLTIGILGIDDIHVERDLPVDTDGLDLLNQRSAGSPQHTG